LTNFLLGIGLALSWIFRFYQGYWYSRKLHSSDHTCFSAPVRKCRHHFSKLYYSSYLPLSGILFPFKHGLQFFLFYINRPCGNTYAVRAKFLISVHFVSGISYVLNCTSHDPASVLLCNSYAFVVMLSSASDHEKVIIRGD
jgi:hypothetical protein